MLNLGLVQQVPVRRGALAVLALAALASCARACDGAQRAREEPAAARGPAAHADAGRAPLRLVLIGDLEGVLEPCGCTTRPLGGVDRLAAAVAAARRGAQEAIVVAAGDLFTSAAQGARAEPRAQDALQTDALSAVLARIGVDVLAPGAADRARAPEAVAALARTTRAAMLGTGPHPPALDAMAPRAVVRRAVDVGVVTAGSGAPAEVAAAAAQADALRGAGAALVIAFVSGDAEAAAAVAAGTRADFVVASGVAERRAAASVLPGGALLLSGGRRGEQVLTLDVAPAAGRGAWSLVDGTPGPRGAVARVRDLDRDAAADAEVRALLDQLFTRVGALNRQAFGAAEPPAPRAGEPSYVGARTCAACHTAAYLWWQRTPHARAFDTLRARHRELDLDCIGCHVTGYEQPGGSSVGRLEELTGVGCESCHGPGSAHVNNPQQPGRAIRRAVTEATCTACHDREHSDRFEYTRARGALLTPAHGAAR